MHKHSFFTAIMRSGVLVVVLWAAAIQVYAGITIGGTRFVYLEGERSISFSVRNPSQQSYLIYTKVEPGGAWQGADTSPLLHTAFVATPQIFSLRPARENTVRIIYTGGDLPADRETLFTLNVAAIPSSNHHSAGVQMAVRSRFKLFYRPTGLTVLPDDAWQSLRWSRSHNKVAINNPTPYYITLHKLRLGEKNVNDGGIVAPFSQRLLDGCQTSKICQIRWQTINDYGRIMPERTQTLAP